MREGNVVAILGVGNKAVDYTENDVEIVSYLADVAWKIVNRKRSEEAFKSMYLRQQALLAAVPDIIVEVDVNKVYTWANQAGFDFFGEELIGRKASYYFEGEQKIYDAAKPLFNGREDVIYVESWQRRRDGKKRLLAWWCRLLKDTSGNISGALSSARDITQQLRQTAQLQQAQKMESVGRLAGGVAHDYNNMLGIILGYTEMALEKVAPSDPLHSDLMEIFNAGKRSAEITCQLLTFARKQTIDPKVIDLNEVVVKMLKMFRRLIGEDIDIVWQPKHPLWHIKIDPSQIEQILVNLCINARDAIAGVGEIIIETHAVIFNKSYCIDHIGFIPGEFVLLVVNDDGCGMEKKTLANIFEPFFTTKGLSQGTGLGLATVYGIVKQNNGFINVYSEPGEGTSFKIYLPRCEGGVKDLETHAAAKIQTGGGEMILLVEDEPGMRSMIQKILERLGYQVQAAGFPGEALRMAEEYGEKIRLLLTDVVMPEMNGRELSEQLKKFHPDIKTIFMSGYTANVIAHRGVLEDGMVFIQKPFSRHALAAKVRETLE